MTRTTTSARLLGALVVALCATSCISLHIGGKAEVADAPVEHIELDEGACADETCCDVDA